VTDAKTRADDLVDALGFDDHSNRGGIAVIVRRAIESAVEEEREACARLVETEGGINSGGFARRIRSRGLTPEGVRDLLRQHDGNVFQEGGSADFRSRGPATTAPPSALLTHVDGLLLDVPVELIEKAGAVIESWQGATDEELAEADRAALDAEYGEPAPDALLEAVSEKRKP